MRSSNRVLIADDHPLTREGLALAARVALSDCVVHGAGTIAEATELLDEWRSCRLILLDFILPDAHGYAGFLTLQSIVPRTPIAMISAREDPSLVEAAKALGAAGFLFKSRPLDEIAAGLRTIAAGHTCFPLQVAPDKGIAAARARIGELSRAQNLVLMALADGRSNKQIAFNLEITEATVKAHMTAIFRKLGVANRSQALLAVQPLFQAGVLDEGR